MSSLCLILGCLIQSHTDLQYSECSEHSTSELSPWSAGGGGGAVGIEYCYQLIIVDTQNVLFSRVI